MVESSSGALLLRASTPLISSDEGAKASRLTVVNRSDRHYTTTVFVGRTEGSQFTPQDHGAASAAAEVLNGWAASVRVSTSRRDRRSGAPGFHEVMERSAREAVERGMPVSAVVLLIRDAALSPGSTQRWVAGMRGQMRPSDLAGMLVEGEIGFLMHDTTAQHAKSIASRLRAVVDGLPGADPILIGVATRVPGLPMVDGIVREARADALSSRGTELNVAIAREAAAMMALGDRRARVRLEVVGALWATLELTEPARVVNISKDGALLTSPVAMPPESVQPLAPEARRSRSNRRCPRAACATCVRP